VRAFLFVNCFTNGCQRQVRIDFSAPLSYVPSLGGLMSGYTGETCKESGVYRCQSHTTNTIPIAKGNRFPPCSLNGGHGTTWVLVYRA